MRERVRQLESLIMPSVHVPIEWRLTPAEARVFQHLTSRDVATKQSIMTALYSDRADDEVEIKIVDVFVCKMRKKLTPFGVGITTIWGTGYALNDRNKFAGRSAA